MPEKLASAAIEAGRRQRERTHRGTVREADDGQAVIHVVRIVEIDGPLGAVDVEEEHEPNVSCGRIEHAPRREREQVLWRGVTLEQESLEDIE